MPNFVLSRRASTRLSNVLDLTSFQTWIQIRRPAQNLPASWAVGRDSYYQQIKTQWDGFTGVITAAIGYPVKLYVCFVYRTDSYAVYAKDIYQLFKELIIKKADPLLGLPPQLIEKPLGTGEGWLFC